MAALDKRAQLLLRLMAIDAGVSEAELLNKLIEDHAADQGIARKRDKPEGEGA